MIGARSNTNKAKTNPNQTEPNQLTEGPMRPDSDEDDDFDFPLNTGLSLGPALQIPVLASLSMPASFSLDETAPAEESIWTKSFGSLDPFSPKAGDSEAEATPGRRHAALFTQAVDGDDQETQIDATGVSEAEGIRQTGFADVTKSAKDEKDMVAGKVMQSRWRGRARGAEHSLAKSADEALLQSVAFDAAFREWKSLALVAERVSVGVDVTLPVALPSAVEEKNAEMSWLLRHHVPGVVRQLSSDLELAYCSLQCIIPRNAVPWGPEGPSDSDDGYYRLSDERLAMSGYLFFDGESRIVQMDVGMKHTNPKHSSLVRTGIHPSKSYEIQQLKNMRRMIKTVKSELVWNPSPDGDVDLGECLRIFKSAFQSLLKIIDELSIRPQHFFPKSSMTEFQVFQPPLPNDMILQIGVKMTRLVVEIFGLTNISNERLKSFKTNGVEPCNILDYAGKIVTHQNRPHEVTHHQIIEIRVQRIESLHQNLSCAYERCAETIRKLSIFE